MYTRIENGLQNVDLRPNFRQTIMLCSNVVVVSYANESKYGRRLGGNFLETEVNDLFASGITRRCGSAGHTE